MVPHLVVVPILEDFLSFLEAVEEGDGVGGLWLGDWGGRG